jgi:hypothetical protein
MRKILIHHPNHLNGLLVFSMFNLVQGLFHMDHKGRHLAHDLVGMGYIAIPE